MDHHKKALFTTAQYGGHPAARPIGQNGKRQEEEEWGKMKWRWIPPRAICFGIRKLNPI